MKKIITILTTVLAMTILFISGLTIVFASDTQLDPNIYFNKTYNMDFWIYSEPHFLDQEIHWDDNIKARKTMSNDKLTIRFEDWNDYSYDDVVFNIQANNNLIKITKLSYNTAAPDPTTLKLDFDEGTFLKIIEEDRTYSGQEITLKLWDDVRNNDYVRTILIPKPINGVCDTGTVMVNGACAIDDNLINETGKDLSVTQIKIMNNSEKGVRITANVNYENLDQDNVYMTLYDNGNPIINYLRNFGGDGNYLFDTNYFLISEGSHTFRLVADSYDYIDEVDESNNEATITYNNQPINISPQKDVSVDSMYFDNAVGTDYTSSNKRINVKISYKNMHEPMKLQLFDNNQLIQTQDFNLRSYGYMTWNSQMLSPNNEYHKYTIKLDPYNVIKETDETNNVRSLINYNNKVDLQVVSFKKYDYVETNQYMFRAQVYASKNTGDVSVALYEDKVLVQKGTVSSMAGTNQVWISKYFNPTSEKHVYTFKVDPDHEIKETNENNNEASITLNEYQKTDLEISKVFIDEIDNVNMYTQIKIGVLIKFTDVNAYAKLILYDNGEPLAAITPLPQFNGSGKLYWYSQVITPTVGNHLYTVQIDPSNYIAESDESNNDGSVDYYQESQNNNTATFSTQLIPVSQRIERGKQAEFKLKITDKHGIADEEFVYNIGVDAPFKNDLPAFIKITSGESKTLIFHMDTSEPLIEVNDYNKKIVDSTTYFFTINVISKNEDEIKSAKGLMIIYDEIRPPELPGQFINLKLKEGWNLLSIPENFETFDSSDCEGKKPIAFVYYDKENRYLSLNEAQNILGEEFDTYISEHSFWVYSYEKCVIKVEQSIFQPDSWNLIDGWNFVPVKTDMLKGKLNEIIPCATVAYRFKNNNWQFVNLKSTLNKNDLGVGLIVKTSNACNLNMGSDDDTSLIPPELPEVYDIYEGDKPILEPIIESDSEESTPVVLQEEIVDKPSSSSSSGIIPSSVHSRNYGDTSISASAPLVYEQQ